MIEEDVEEGHSGICSGCHGLCSQGENYKPRVHPGFYRKFWAALLITRKHVVSIKWKPLTQEVVVVTADSLRSICHVMKQLTDGRRGVCGEKNVRFYRLPTGNDAVTTVPLNADVSGTTRMFTKEAHPTKNGRENNMDCDEYQSKMNR
jgi:hypothetical protein